MRRILFALLLFLNCIAFAQNNLEKEIVLEIKESNEISSPKEQKPVEIINLNIGETTKTFEEEYLSIKNDTEKIVNESLIDTKLKENDFIKLHAFFSQEGKLQNIQTKAFSINEKQAQKIVDKLNTVLNFENKKTFVSKYNIASIYLFKSPDNNNLESEIYFLNDELLNNKEICNEAFDKLYEIIIKNNLYTYKENLDEINISVLINNHGKIISSKLITSSGNSEFDKSTLDKIKTLSLEGNNKNTDTIQMFVKINNKDKFSQKIKKGLIEAQQNSFDGYASIELNNKGELLNAEITKSTGNSIYDALVLKSINQNKNYSELLRFNNNNYVINFYFNQNPKSKHGFSAILVKENNGALVDWKKYLAALELQAKSNWFAVKSTTPYNIKALLVIDKQGNIKDIKIIESSNMKDADEAVIESLFKGAPYMALPQEVKKETLAIELNFTYHIKQYSPAQNVSNNNLKTNKPKSKFIKLIEETNPDFGKYR